MESFVKIDSKFKNTFDGRVPSHNSFVVDDSEILGLLNLFVGGAHPFDLYIAMMVPIDKDL